MKGFSNTRWFSREEVTNEIAENYHRLADFVEMLVADEIGDVLPKKMQQVLQAQGNDLQASSCARKPSPPMIVCACSALDC